MSIESVDRDEADKASPHPVALGAKGANGKRRSLF